MPVRALLALTLAAAMLPACATAAPEFAPNPRQAFEGFVAINPPRGDVPVGALWINGFGPTGDGADKDNLATDRSLSALTIDKNLQLSLSAGLLQLFGIDPRARDHYVARFTDLSLVRVKDVSKLSGPRGEPRIIEALKAGSVTISSDSAIGLSGQNSPWQRKDVEASGTADRSHLYSIEARDMFIAIHVATPELTRSGERLLKISEDGGSARLDDYLVVVRPGHCEAPSTCPPELGIEKISTQMPASLATVQVGADGRLEVPLPVPASDGNGGLFTKVALRWIAPCSEVKADGCGRQPRLSAHYEGTRLQDVAEVKGKGW
jgi:hypothetical protein